MHVARSGHDGLRGTHLEDVLGYFWISHGKARGVSSGGGGRRRVQLYRRGQQDAGDGAFTCFFRHPTLGPHPTARAEGEAATPGAARVPPSVLGSGAAAPVIVLRPPVHVIVVADVMSVSEAGGCSGRGGGGCGGGAVVDLGLCLELRAQLHGGEGAGAPARLARLVRDGQDVRVKVLLAFVAGHVRRGLPAAEAARRAAHVRPGARVSRAAPLGLRPRLAEVGALGTRRPLSPQAFVLGLAIVRLLVLLVDGVVHKVGGGVGVVPQRLRDGAALESTLIRVLILAAAGPSVLLRRVLGEFGARQARRRRHQKVRAARHVVALYHLLLAVEIGRRVV